jgi:hypothetical protein
MTAKEYRDKEAITSANFWDGDEINFHMIYEFAEDYHQAKLDLLTIPVVVGQSKQLVCDKEELDCPYDFTSRCTMGRCDCEIKAN